MIFMLLVTLCAVTYIASVIAIEWRGLGRQYRAGSRIVSLAILILGIASLIVYLGHGERIFGVLRNPGSGLFLECLMMILTGIVIIIYLIMLHRKTSDTVLKAVASIGVIPSFVLIFAVGYSYMLPGRPAWNTYALPAFWIAAALTMICFSVYTFSVFCNDSIPDGTADGGDITSKAKPEPARTTVLFQRAVLIAAAVQAAALAAYLACVAAAPYQEESRSIARIVSGDLAPLFWGGVVFSGFFIPAAVVIWGRVKKTESPVAAVFGYICMLAAAVSFLVLLSSIGSKIMDFGY